MYRSHASVSLAELAAAGVQLRPYEAVTLVRELLDQVVRGEVAGVPSSPVIRLSPEGTVFVEGPVAAGGPSVVRAAQLLESLLPTTENGDQFRVPGGLRLIVARATGTLDVPAFPSLQSFSEALARFGATDSAATIVNLLTTWTEASGARAANARREDVPAQVEPFVAVRAAELLPAGAAELTISDIRRARRATGLALAEVARKSELPLGMLRQLEWGYLKHWPEGLEGRDHLARYARAAGLDEQLVIGTVVPLIAEADVLRDAPVLPVRRAMDAVAEVPAVTVETVVLPVQSAWAVARTKRETRRASRRRARVAAALAIPALIAIGVVPVWLAHSSEPPAAAGAATTAAAPEAGAPAPVPAPAVRDARVADAQPAAGPPSAPVRTPAAQPRPSEATPTYRLASDSSAYSPSFASAGAAMFYHDNADGPAALMRADTDSRGAVLQITRVVDDNARNWHVRPSPDGSQIAFDSDRGGERGIYVADAQGRNVRRVSPEGFAAVPSWSHDGSKLAFVRAEPDQPKVWNLWTLDLASGDLQQVTHNRIGQPWGGSWFPDGRRIAYSHETRLVIRDLESGAERTFASPVRGRLLRTPAVSPDGKRVIFQVHRDGAWLLELGDRSMRKVLDDPTAEEYTWSPDGKRVAYHSRRADGWGVWVMAPRSR